MKVNIQDKTLAALFSDAAEKPRMTAAMREGLEALQREYEAFREASFQTLALISNHRISSK